MQAENKRWRIQISGVPLFWPLLTSHKCTFPLPLPFTLHSCVSNRLTDIPHTRARSVKCLSVSVPVKAKHQDHAQVTKLHAYSNLYCNTRNEVSVMEQTETNALGPLLSVSRAAPSHRGAGWCSLSTDNNIHDCDYSVVKLYGWW